HRRTEKRCPPYIRSEYPWGGQRRSCPPDAAAGGCHRRTEKRCPPYVRQVPSSGLPVSSPIDWRQGRLHAHAAILATHHGARPRCEGHRPGAEFPADSGQARQPKIIQTESTYTKKNVLTEYPRTRCNRPACNEQAASRSFA